ncbi:MAG TPA: hypothetical protein VJI98_05885 [Candidatus Nanoarchaeia archaeon]|nr:hypothetical protein [Candidatus Nanoarchaeia archaeon]
MVNTIIGIIGLIFILAAFVLDEFFKKFNQDTVHYNLFNILGSVSLIIYSFQLMAWPFLILNIVWLLTASFKLSRILIGRFK